MRAVDSYVIDKKTRDDSMRTLEFYEGDPEIEMNREVIQLRISLVIIELNTDASLPSYSVLSWVLSLDFITHSRLCSHFSYLANTTTGWIISAVSISPTRVESVAILYWY
jgi:hypothetical protein